MIPQLQGTKFYALREVSRQPCRVCYNIVQLSPQYLFYADIVLGEGSVRSRRPVVGWGLKSEERDWNNSKTHKPACVVFTNDLSSWMDCPQGTTAIKTRETEHRRLSCGAMGYDPFFLESHSYVAH